MACRGLTRVLRRGRRIFQTAPPRLSGTSPKRLRITLPGASPERFHPARNAPNVLE